MSQVRKWRINLILIFIILFSALISGRLFFIQVLNHDFYKALAQGQQKSFIQTKGVRGEILFKNGEPLAKNKNWQLVFASPKEIVAKEETAETLSQILNLDKNLILEKFKKDNFYAVIKNKLTEQELAKLKEINLAGIYLAEESGRYYPQEDLASQAVGFWGKEEKGQYGLEGYYDQILQGKEVFQERERSILIFSFLESANKEKSRGLDLILTLDYNVQFMAEKLLKEAKDKLGIESGQILVISPHSGKIFALANFPNFNPNKYDEYAKKNNFEIFQNSAIQKIFEPGSSFKPITMAAALEEEKITPQTTYVDEGQVKIGGHTISNYDNRVWGQKTMAEVLEKSINTGAVFAERQLGNELFLKYIEKFGFFEKTGIDLQGEIFSANSEFKKGYEVNFATASFGQGIEMTPIQLARAYCAIANGGKLVKPYLVENVPERNNEKGSEQNIISSKTTSQLTAMMVSVTERGFGKAAKIPGYYIAGKTGTAQIPFENKRGYYQDRTIQTFVGFAPAFNPQFLILVKLDNPKTKTAEYSAVPIFHDLAEYIIHYWQIPPDYEL